MVSLPNPAQNQLLAALPVADCRHLLAALEWVPLRLGELIHQPGVPMQHAYFPTTAVISLHCVLASGAAVETASIGREGVVGLPLLPGGETLSHAAMVQASGHGYRIERQAFEKELQRAGVLPTLLLRYTQKLLMQMTQMAVCNRHHSVEQQFCRCLLTTLDLLHEAERISTQDLIAHLFGVHRETLREAASRLEQAGYIRYRRGQISILDRAGLERSSCECYEVLKHKCQYLMPEAAPRWLH